MKGSCEYPINILKGRRYTVQTESDGRSGVFILLKERIIADDVSATGVMVRAIL